MTRVREYAALLLSGVLYALALKYFVLPSRVILTGTEGIAASLSYYLDSEAVFLGLYVAFQAALLAFAWWKLSRVFALRTLVVVATVVLSLSLLPEFMVASPEPENERIILVLFGGLIAGFAKAVSFRYRGSTGDEDVVAAWFAVKYLKPVGSIAIISAAISTLFGLTLEFLTTGQLAPVINTLMYTCIYIFASAETLNNLYHKFQLTMLTVVTQDAQAVGDAIKEAFPHRTFTVQDSVGGHSGRAFRMVRAVVTREELPEMLDAIEAAEPNCFYYHHDVEGVSSRYHITPIQ